MPAGRPSKVEVDSSLFCGLRGKWRGVKETEWCAFAMERQSDWLPVLGVTNFDRYDLEFHLEPNGNRKSGLPRIDAVGWRNGKASLIEAKVDVSPSSVLGGVGQLLYYNEIVRATLNWEIEDMILIAPAWPLFLLESIERHKLPISLVQVTPETVYGRRSA